MRAYIGLGSNLGNRRANLEAAARKLRGACGQLRVSPIYENPAMVPPGAPPDWNRPFLNAVSEIDWQGNAEDLLRFLKQTETEMGRTEAARWAPRVLDLDLLLFGDVTIESDELNVPHAQMHERSFVMDPLKDLAPHLRLPHLDTLALKQARSLSHHRPLVMGILNLTPDSFSDGGQIGSTPEFLEKAKRMIEAGVQILDLGGESTRPGAHVVSPDIEWSRLENPLRALKGLVGDAIFRPLISIDTRNFAVAERALELGVDIINDVSGLAEKSTRELIRQAECDVVVMHSLTVPAETSVTLEASCDPVEVLKTWVKKRARELVDEGLDPQHLIFDPGLGFGKTPAQSWEIVNRFDELRDIPYRWLVGHSRKSFLRKSSAADDIDAATLAVTHDLSRRGVDIVRVHDFEAHGAALGARKEYE